MIKSKDNIDITQTRENASDLKESRDVDLGARVYTGIGNVKEDTNKWESFKHASKPMQDFWIMTDNVMQVYAITLALKFNIFEKLAELKSGTTAKDLASQLSINIPARRFVDWLDQLYVHGFLEREGVLEDAKYRNSAYTEKYFLKDSEHPHYYTYLKNYKLLSSFNELESIIPSGKFKDSYSNLLASEDTMRVAAAFNWRANEHNFELLAKNCDFSKFKTVVDISGKNGCLSAYLAKQFPNVTFISFDDKKWEKLQKEIAQKKGDFPSNLKFEYGNPLTKIPEADCILVPELIQYLGTEDRKKLGDNLYAALRENGKLIILENVTSEERNIDDCGLKASFMTVMLGIEGYAASLKEHQQCLSKHGFKDIDIGFKGDGNMVAICASK